MDAAVSFLTHPRVRASSVSMADKVAFLLHKGISREDIGSALAQVYAADPEALARASEAVYGAPPLAPDSSLGVLGAWVLTLAGFITGFCSAPDPPVCRPLHPVLQQTQDMAEVLIAAKLDSAETLRCVTRFSAKTRSRTASTPNTSHAVLSASIQSLLAPK